MFFMFLVFISGALSYRIFQFLLAITPNFNIFKRAEYTAIATIAQMHLMRFKALQIIKTVYNETDRSSDYVLVENEINKRYDSLINSCIDTLKDNLPYKTDYRTLPEAMAYLSKENGENR